VLVVSPHLDDAVFACGDLIAAHPGARVVTVFAGGPPPEQAHRRGWDADCGFDARDDVIRLRRAEDREALARLRAEAVWLPFRDDQYGRDADVDEIAEPLTRVVDATKPSVVAIPLGIFHRDHLLAHDAARAVCRARPEPTWLVYEDAIYRRFPGDPVSARIAALRADGCDVRRAGLGGWPASTLKREAVACYRSQLRGLATAGRPGHQDAFAPEAYWSLRTPATAPHGDSRPRRVPGDAAASSAPT